MDEVINALQGQNINVNSESAVEIARMIVIQNYVELAAQLLILFPLVLGFLLICYAAYKEFTKD